MKTLLAISVLTLGLTACTTDEDRLEAVALTEQSFANSEEVGTLPDGRKVFVVYHSIAGYYSRSIYFVQNGGVTTNQVVPNGKSTRLQVNFLAPEMTPEARSRVQDAIDREVAKQKLEDAARLKAEAEKVLAAPQ